MYFLLFYTLQFIKRSIHKSLRWAERIDEKRYNYCTVNGNEDASVLGCAFVVTSSSCQQQLPAPLLLKQKQHLLPAAAYDKRNYRTHEVTAASAHTIVIPMPARVPRSNRKI